VRHPDHPTAAEEQRLDRLQDLGSALDSLRRAIVRGDRISIETFCWTLARRLAVSPIDGDDEDEIRATIGLIEARVKFGIHQRLRNFLLPLVAALEGQIEEAEKDL
jgi:hypothetical protein